MDLEDTENAHLEKTKHTMEQITKFRSRPKREFRGRGRKQKRRKKRINQADSRMRQMNRGQGGKQGGVGQPVTPVSPWVAAFPGSPGQETLFLTSLGPGSLKVNLESPVGLYRLLASFGFLKLSLKAMINDDTYQSSRKGGHVPRSLKSITNSKKGHLLQQVAVDLRRISGGHAPKRALTATLRYVIRSSLPSEHCLMEA